MELTTEETRYTITNFRGILGQIKNHQIRESTKLKYYQAWIRLNRFLLKFDELPNSWEEKLVLYATHLADLGRKPNTINSYISGIRHILRLDGVELSSSSVEIAAITRACKLKEERLQIRLPIHKRLLTLILDQLDRQFDQQPFLQKLYKAICVAGYYGMMRVGEMCSGDHPVLAKDFLTAANKKKHYLILRTSKTHNLGDKPFKITIPSQTPDKERRLFGSITKDFSKYCPFKILQEYVDIRKDRIRVTRESDPLFVFSNKQPVSPENFRTVLKGAIKAINYPVQSYDVHSLRIGRTNDLRKIGLSTAEIRTEGRWKEASRTVFIYFH